VSQESVELAYRYGLLTPDFVMVTVNRIAGVGARSGAPLLFRWAAVFWVREGRLARVGGYLRRGEALKAVGLES
jgi:hypothetical protein